MGRVKNNTPLVCMHSHFKYEERVQLESYLLGTGKLPKITNRVTLGTLLHKHPRTIAREIKRGLVEHFFDEGLQTKLVYNADYAERQARSKDSAKGPQLKLGYDYTLALGIKELIKNKKYSPFAVLAHFNNNQWPSETRICEKTVYNYIYRGHIPEVSEKDLLLKGKKRTENFKTKYHKQPCFAAKSIENRPKEINERTEFGHWEGDTVVGGKECGSECLLTIIERKHRIEITRKIADKSSKSVVKAFSAIERQLGKDNFKKLFKSITFDNGSEFSDIKGIEKSIFNKKNRTTIYFAHPYSAYERGSNERHNGIIRRFIPKGASIGTLKNKYINAVQDWMNNYPRKILKGKTPLMLLKEEFYNNQKILDFFNVKTEAI